MDLTKKLLIVIVSLVLSLSALAQPGGGGDPGHGKPVPLSGIEILLACGAVLGIRRILKGRRRQ